MSTREQKIVKVGVLGILMNALLVGVKGAIGLFSGSVAILMDALNNLTDILSAFVTVVGAKLASRAPDKNHPFGHGRLEDLSAFLVGLIILAAGVGAISEAAPKILAPVEASYSVFSLILILFAVLVKFAFSRYASRVGKEISSSALLATGADAFFDSLLSLSTLIAALISVFLSFNIEGFVGVVIGAFIIKAAIEILSDTAHTLVGARADSDLAKKVKRTVATFPKVRGVYDLMIHSYGPAGLFGSVHIELPDDFTAREIHHLTRDISQKVYDEFGLILTVGIYAKNSTTPEITRIKTTLRSLVKNNPDILQTHGFYVDEKKKLVAFDLVLDFSSQDKEKVRANILSVLSEKYPDYTFEINLDLDTSD